VVVIPSSGRDLWQAEQAGRGEGQGRAPSSLKHYSTAHRSFQDDKQTDNTVHEPSYSGRDDKVIGITEQGQPYSTGPQIPPCGRDDKAVVMTGR
jgi:hypothetical protein